MNNSRYKYLIENHPDINTTHWNNLSVDDVEKIRQYDYTEIFPEPLLERFVQQYSAGNISGRAKELFRILVPDSKANAKSSLNLISRKIDKSDYPIRARAVYLQKKYADVVAEKEGRDRTALLERCWDKIEDTDIRATDFASISRLIVDTNGWKAAPDTDNLPTLQLNMTFSEAKKEKKVFDELSDEMEKIKHNGLPILDVNLPD